MPIDYTNFSSQEEIHFVLLFFRFFFVCSFQLFILARKYKFTNNIYANERLSNLLFNSCVYFRRCITISLFTLILEPLETLTHFNTIRLFPLFVLNRFCNLKTNFTLNLILQ